MKCEFSETQFSFGILFEMLSTLTPAKGWSAPFLPTLAQERSYGFDAQITGPVNVICLQFKVPRKLTQKNAKHWSTIYKGEYFEFDVRPDIPSGQHNKLVSLANSDPRFKVSYCAPAFIKKDEFEEHYKNRELALHSLFLRCDKLMTISGKDKHSISYRLEPTREYNMHSRRISIEALSYAEFIKDVFEGEKFKNLEECVKVLSDKLDISTNTNNTTVEQLVEIQTQLFIEYDIHLLVF